jgi:hypothetical protein
MKNIIIIVLAIFVLASCSKDVLNVKNESSYAEETYFTNAKTLTEASTAMYAPLLFQGMYEREGYFVFDLLGNDADKNTPLSGSLLSYENYTFNSSSEEIRYFFNACYKMVFRANFTIDAVNKWIPSAATASSDSALKVRIIGEAEFIKSLANFWLVTCFGDVPLKKTLADHYVMQQGRTPKAEIWADIETNLTDAISRLPLAQDYSASDYGRASRGAAVALLGKAYLYQKKYTDAATRFLSLTQTPYQYGLDTLDNIFIRDKKTKETIFAVMHGAWQGWGVGNAYAMFGGQEQWGQVTTHTGRAQEYGFNDWWNVLVSTALVNAYKYKDESNNDYVDPRAKLLYYSNPAQGGDTTYCDECAKSKSYYFEIRYDDKGKVKDTVKRNMTSWRKYEMYEMRYSYGNPDSYINSQIIRYADVLLMLAECYIENNQVSDARPLINLVRKRSGAFEYSTLGSQAQARTILRHERQIELAGEQVRFFDLVRWGILKETINAEKQVSIGQQPVQDKHVLLPIPQAERNANPVLDAQVKDNWN